jgi:hypothetical protein
MPRTCAGKIHAAPTLDSLAAAVRPKPECKRKWGRKKIKMKLILVKLNFHTTRYLRAG